MRTIGIDQDNYLVYECNNSWGHAIWPTPHTIPATIFDESASNLTPKENNHLVTLPYLYIDDGYDPTSRVRKGRIYERHGPLQPSQCFVYPHPAIPNDISAVNENGVIEKTLASFRAFNYSAIMKRRGFSEPIVVLGSNDQFTIWSVIDVETSIAGETIIYLKSRKSMGFLPKVNFSKIEDCYHAQIRDKLDLLLEDVYKAGADSIVDRAREAASAIINAYLLSQGHIDKHKDLGQLATPLKDKEQKYITANCVDTLAKLHSRAKTVEQSNKGLRAINEHDAELAVNSVGMILVELDFASW